MTSNRDIEKLIDAKEDEDVCEQCGGTGEVSYDEQDRDGNWQRGVGTRVCECQIREDDNYEDQ